MQPAAAPEKFEVMKLQAGRRQCLILRHNFQKDAFSAV